MTEPLRISLRLAQRPWTVNAERAGSSRGIGGHRGRAELTTTWREAFALLAVEGKVPPMRTIELDVQQVCRNNKLPDIGACYPAFKAALDGLVDAQVVPDDNGTYVTSITFWPPYNGGYDALEITLTGEPCSRDERAEREASLRDRLAANYIRRASRSSSS